MKTGNIELDQAIEILNNYIQKNLYDLHPKTTDRWWEVKRAIEVHEHNRNRKDSTEPIMMA